MLQSVQATTHVGDDGVLSLTLKMPPEFSNKDVQVTVHEARSPFADRDEYLAFLNEIKGAWQGEFERPDQGWYEERDSLD